MKWRLRGVLVLQVFILWGCASGDYTVEDQNKSLGQIKNAIVAIMGDPRHLSENQREYTSQYFSRKDDAKFDPEKSKERQ